MPEQAHDSADLVTARRVMPVRKGYVRLWAAVVLAGCLGILGLAAYLRPDPSGQGTHCQLGFGKCGMLVLTGLPCPTCGMTTAFAHTVRGQFVRAFLAQPTGFVLALGTIAAALLSAWTLVRGRVPPIRVPALGPMQLFLLLFVLLVGGWAFKLIYGLITGTLPERP